MLTGQKDGYIPVPVNRAKPLEEGGVYVHNGQQVVENKERRRERLLISHLPFFEFVYIIFKMAIRVVIENMLVWDDIAPVVVHLFCTGVHTTKREEIILATVF